MEDSRTDLERAYDALPAFLKNLDGPEAETHRPDTPADEIDNRAALEFVIGGACLGIALGWALHAAWTGDWPALAMAGGGLVAFVVYRSIRITRSVGGTD